MLSEKEQLKDISSIGLKTVINQLPNISTQMSSNIVKKITGRLLNTIQKVSFVLIPSSYGIRVSWISLPFALKDDLSVQLETLDILSEILNHFGNLLVNYHSQILSCLLVQLNSQRLAVRKRAIVAISYLVSCCNTVLFNELLNALLNELNKKVNNSISKTYIQCLAAARWVTCLLKGV